MSAYASSFGSLLPPVARLNNETKINYPNKDLNQTQFDAKDEAKKKSLMVHNSYEPTQYESAVQIKVQSASVDFGIIAASTRGASLMSKHPQDFLALADAVQFRLLMNFNGRKYTIVRTFADFVKLRIALIKELIHIEKISISRSKDHRQIEGVRNKKCSEAGVLIPELPNGVSDHPLTNPGLSRFAKAQSLLLYHYSPLMECWMKRVINTIDVESSVCFNNFFWEPLRDDENILSFILCTSAITGQENASKKARRSSSISALTLSSIPEDFGDFDSDYDD